MPMGPNGVDTCPPHLFMLSGRSDRTKLVWIIVGSVGVAVHLVAPWIARSAASWSGVLYGVSGCMLGASFVVMALVPLLEMWVSNEARGQAATPT